MKTSLLILAGICLCVAGCENKIEKKDAWSTGLSACSGRPVYIDKSSINPKYAALSTSEKKIKGLALIDVTTHQYWQHPSWSKYGTLGPIATDKYGNSYIAPVPVINILSNIPDEQNTLYRVDGVSGEMKTFLTLPMTNKSTEENPYGLIGLHYDCHAEVLFASSIMGSEMNTENGTIYIVNVEEPSIIDQLDHIDALGMAVSGTTGEKRLYFGSCRQSDIYSIEIGKNSHFIGKPQLEFSLDMLGPRGDDKARKIIFKSDGEMIIKGIAFDYNLTAPTEKLESEYSFIYDRALKKWLINPAYQ